MGEKLFREALAVAALTPGSYSVRLNVDDYSRRWKFDNAVLGQQA